MPGIGDHSNISWLIPMARLTTGTTRAEAQQQIQVLFSQLDPERRTDSIWRMEVKESTPRDHNSASLCLCLWESLLWYCLRLAPILPACSLPGHRSAPRNLPFAFLLVPPGAESSANYS